MATNDITGDQLKSKVSTNAYRDGWDAIFGKKEITKQDILENIDALKELHDSFDERKK